MWEYLHLDHIIILGRILRECYLWYCFAYTHTRPSRVSICRSSVCQGATSIKRVCACENVLCYREQKQENNFTNYPFSCSLDVCVVIQKGGLCLPGAGVPFESCVSQCRVAPADRLQWCAKPSLTHCSATACEDHLLQHCVCLFFFFVRAAT